MDFDTQLVMDLGIGGQFIAASGKCPAFRGFQQRSAEPTPSLFRYHEPPLQEGDRGATGSFRILPQVNFNKRYRSPVIWRRYKHRPTIRVSENLCDLTFTLLLAFGPELNSQEKVIVKEKVIRSDLSDRKIEWHRKIINLLNSTR